MVRSATWRTSLACCLVMLTLSSAQAAKRAASPASANEKARGQKMKGCFNSVSEDVGFVRKKEKTVQAPPTTADTCVPVCPASDNTRRLLHTPPEVFVLGRRLTQAPADDEYVSVEIDDELADAFGAALSEDQVDNLCNLTSADSPLRKSMKEKGSKAKGNNGNGNGNKRLLMSDEHEQARRSLQATGVCTPGSEGLCVSLPAPYEAPTSSYLDLYNILKDNGIHKGQAFERTDTVAGALQAYRCFVMAETIEVAVGVCQVAASFSTWFGFGGGAEVAPGKVICESVVAALKVGQAVCQRNFGYGNVQDGLVNGWEINGAYLNSRITIQNQAALRGHVTDTTTSVTNTVIDKSAKIIEEVNKASTTVTQTVEKSAGDTQQAIAALEKVVKAEFCRLHDTLALIMRELAWHRKLILMPQGKQPGYLSNPTAAQLGVTPECPNPAASIPSAENTACSTAVQASLASTKPSWTCW